MNAIEVISSAPPQEARNAATAAEAAAWLKNPTAPQAAPNQQFILQLETDAPLCRNCGNLMQRTGHCHACPTCGESDGCA